MGGGGGEGGGACGLLVEVRLGGVWREQMSEMVGDEGGGRRGRWSERKMVEMLGLID